MWHLDSNAVIGFLNGDKPLDERVQANLDELAVSTLVVAELLFGARNSARAAKNLARLKRFLELVDVVDFDAACADAYSRIRLSLRKKGKPTGEMDMLIASVAIAHDATLVTHNLKHFKAIDGLKLEDWRA
jgi:tRNA(fMet)-specific endonuclease VapC